MPFGHRHSLLGHPVPPRGSAPLTIGLADLGADGFDVRLDHDGVSTFHSLESRPEWVPSLPRDLVVLSWPVSCLRPPCAPSAKGKVLSPRSTSHHPRLSDNEASSRVHSRSPARPSSWPGDPRMEQGLLGHGPRASHSADQEPATRAGAGDGRLSTCPELRHQHHRSSDRRSPLTVSDSVSHHKIRLVEPHRHDAAGVRCSNPSDASLLGVMIGLDNRHPPAQGAFDLSGAANQPARPWIRG